MIKKNFLFLLLSLALSSGLLAKPGTGTLDLVINKTDSLVKIFRTEDKRTWSVGKGSSKFINDFIPWCSYGRIEIEIGGSVKFSFGEQDTRLVRACDRGKVILTQNIKGRKYALMITGTAAAPRFDFFEMTTKRQARRVKAMR